VIDDTNITVISGSFTEELLAKECHEHFIEDFLGKPICGAPTIDKKNRPSTAQRIFCSQNKR
jgi:hypothetical protein